MNIKCLKKIFGADLVDDCVSANPLTMAEQEEIRRKFLPNQKVRSHRQRAIDAVIKLKLWFGSSFNNYYEVMQRFVKVTCPYCEAEMKHHEGGASPIACSVTYKCPGCSSTVTLNMLTDYGFRAEPHPSIAWSDDK